MNNKEMVDTCIVLDIWYKLYCPHCDSINWLEADSVEEEHEEKGHLYDACTCCNCQKDFWITDLIKEFAEGDFSDACVGIGKETPY